MSAIYLYDANGIPVVAVNSAGYKAIPVYLTNGSGGGTSALDMAPFSAGSTLGTPIMGEDPTSGELLVVQLAPGTRQLASAVTVTPPASNTVSAVSLLTVSAATQLLAANAARKKFILQNTGTVAIYLLYGAGTPSSSNFHRILAPGGNPKDGTGAIVEDIMWTGALQAISASAGGTLAIEEFT